MDIEVAKMLIEAFEGAGAEAKSALIWYIVSMQLPKLVATLFGFSFLFYATKKIMHEVSRNCQSERQLGKVQAALGFSDYSALDYRLQEALKRIQRLKDGCQDSKG